MSDTSNDNNYSHVLKYTGIFGGVQGLVILIGLVRNKFMAILLGANGMGFASLLNSVQVFASQCTNLGISFGAVPRLSELHEQGDAAEVSRYIQVIRLWSLLSALLGFVFCVSVSSCADALTFTWGDHTLHYAMLGLSVSMLAITGGETAILKATRKLGALALIQVYSTMAAVVISVPLYYFFQQSGVVPAIVLIALSAMLTTIVYSYRSFPPVFKMNRQLLGEGFGMIRLGVAFILAAVIGSAAEMLIRSFLNVEGGLDEVGLYNVGYMITLTYAGMVFSAMESDYFPRLSAVQGDIVQTNTTVNKQIEVSLMLLSPMLVGLLSLLPLLVPLLFSHEFEPVVNMAQVAILAMYFKVLTLPVAYITLARGYSLSYLFLETSYFVVFVLLVMFSFRHWGILGTGVAIVAAHVFDYLMIVGYAYRKYDYRCTAVIGRYMSVQLSVGLAAYIVSLLLNGWAYWTAEAVLTLISTAYSVRVLRQKTRLWEALKRRLTPGNH